MMITAPKAQIILDYELCFGVEPPEDRISIIKYISKDSILFELAALNYRLKPKDKIEIDTSLETQIKELQYFTKSEGLFKKYSRFAEKFTKNEKDYPNLFSRAACLFAIEEIINSESMQNIDGFVMARIEVWEAILKYLLAVNHAITRTKEEEADKRTNFETLNPKLLPLNELLVETDQLFTPYRGYLLIDFFSKSKEFSEVVRQYFIDEYGIEPQHFIFHLMSIFMVNSSQNPELNFFYLIKDGEEGLFNALSKRHHNKEIFKLLSIRKSPFINVGEQKYLIADNSFLIEKSYSQFLNDFWFDRVKKIKNDSGKPKFTIEEYRSLFGYFFEQYLTSILERSFKNYKYSSILLFDQLKIKTTRGHIEIADVYLRYNKKIFLGQVKSGSIYDKEKFGGEIDLLYKNDRNKFFEDFGVNQLIDSIYRMDRYIKELDPKFPKGHTYQVFPSIIVNDKAFQTPLMPDTFNVRFQELLKDFHIEKVKVNPLTIIHINDFERLEDKLNKNPNEFWDLLKFNHRDKRFAPPFCNTINRKCKGRQYPERILKLFESLIIKYKTNE